MRVGRFEQLRAQALDFVPEQNTDWKSRLSLKQVQRMRAGFDCCELKSAAAHGLRHVEGVPVVLPRYDFFRAQGCFRNRLLRRMRGDSAETQLLEIHSVGRAEECSHVVHAAHVVEQHRRREGDRLVVHSLLKMREDERYHSRPQDRAA